MTHIKRPLAFIAAALVACTPTTAFAERDAKTVDCTSGQSISEAVERKHPGRPLKVIVRGTCMEGVVIAADDIELVADGGAIQGSIVVNGAHRIVIEGFKISNRVGDGILLTDGASATIRWNEVSNNLGYGIFIRNASFAIVENNRLLENGLDNPTNMDGSGIGVSTGSVVRARNNTIRGNANTAIEVFDNSVYRSESDTIEMRPAAPIGRSVVDTFRAGYVELRGAELTGTVLVNQQSQLQIRNGAERESVIAGRIRAQSLSFMRVRAGVGFQTGATVSCEGPYTVCVCDGRAFCPGMDPPRPVCPPPGICPAPGSTCPLPPGVSCAPPGELPPAPVPPT